jgi:hypothetical protein
MSFTENLYLRKHLQKLQEENQQLRSLLEVNAPKTAAKAQTRMQIEDLARKLSSINGHNRSLVQNSLKAVEGAAHPEMLKRILSKLMQHETELKGSAQPSAAPSSPQRSFRSLSVSSAEQEMPAADPSMESMLDEYGNRLANNRPGLAQRIISQVPSPNTGTSSGY